MIWSVVGYVRVKFSGDNLPLLLDELKNNGIEIKNIRTGKNNMYADVAGNRWKKAFDISRSNGVSFSVYGRFGLAMKIFLYKNRIAFFVSFLLFVSLFLVNTFFLKEINVSGNNYLTDNQIKAMLDECGLSAGKATFTIDQRRLQDKMMKMCDRLSWIWIDIKGTTANVDVREKVSLPEFYDKSYACNIVAKRDGIVSEAVSVNGILYAKPGSYVKKGELLVGGVIDSNEYAPVRFVRASGRVMANTKYFLSDKFDSVYKKYHQGKKMYEYTLSVFGYTIRFGTLKDKNVILLNTETKNFEIFGKKFSSLGFTKRKYCEIIDEEYTLDIKDTEKYAVKELTERLKSKLEPGVRITNEDYTLKTNTDGVLSVTVNFDCEEDIAEENIIFVSEE